MYDLCVVCLGSEHTQSALEGLIVNVFHQGRSRHARWLRSWGSQMELVEELETSPFLSQLSPAGSNAFILDPEAYSAVSIE